MKLKTLLGGKKVSKAKQIMVALMGVGLLAAAPDVLAAGGLDKVTSELEFFRAWLYTIVGVVCGGHILWQILQVKVFEKKTWGDVMQSMITTAVAGASLTIANYLWGLFA